MTPANFVVVEQVVKQVTVNGSFVGLDSAALAKRNGSDDELSVAAKHDGSASSPVLVMALVLLPGTPGGMASSPVTVIVETLPVMLGDVPSSPGMPVSASSTAK